MNLFTVPSLNYLIPYSSFFWHCVLTKVSQGLLIGIYMYIYTIYNIHAQ